MREDPIVEEMRTNGLAFAAEYGNDLGRICRALKKLETTSGRKIVNRSPKPLAQKHQSAQ